MPQEIPKRGPKNECLKKASDGRRRPKNDSKNASKMASTFASVLLGHPLGPTWAPLASSLPLAGSCWATLKNLEESWGQLGPNLAQLGANLGHVGALLGRLA